jgi:hypothetical protein
VKSKLRLYGYLLIGWAIVSFALVAYLAWTAKSIHENLSYYGVPTNVYLTIPKVADTFANIVTGIAGLTLGGIGALFGSVVLFRRSK